MLVKLSGISTKGDPFDQLGRVAARRDMRSTYKVFLREGDPLATFQRLPSVWSMGNDDGTMRASVEGAQEGVLELSGHDFCPPALCRLHTAFFSTTLELAEAVDVFCLHSQCKAEGADSCVWRCKWRSP
jgi:hypothetical protein